MGDLGWSLARFLIWSSDLPMRASTSLANLRFALLCCGVWACMVGKKHELVSQVLQYCRRANCGGTSETA
jgi:hypothetical protein